MCQMPHTGDLATTAGMPIALLVSPLALPDPRDDQIQVWRASEITSHQIIVV